MTAKTFVTLFIRAVVALSMITGPSAVILGILTLNYMMVGLGYGIIILTICVVAIDRWRQDEDNG